MRCKGTCSSVPKQREKLERKWSGAQVPKSDAIVRDGNVVWLAWEGWYFGNSKKNKSSTKSVFPVCLSWRPLMFHKNAKVKSNM